MTQTRHDQLSIIGPNVTGYRLQVNFANFDFLTKLEAVSKIENKGNRNQLAILQRPHLQNLKSLSYLVQSTGSYNIIKGHIRKNSKKFSK